MGVGVQVSLLVLFFSRDIISHCYPTFFNRDLMKALLIIILITIPIFVSGQTLEKKNRPDRPKIGLVLSGGGAKGLAHIGVLKILEEQGIRPDYITGTSMGSIVGALYALGYSAAQLDSIVAGIDWNGVFSDELSRRMLSMEEKSDHGRFILEIPIREFSISFPKGLIAGHKLSLLLTRLMLPGSSISDFDKLPIPFRCIATDLETGKAVVLKQGYLAKATRASMAIPTVVTPVEIDGHLLVDGGIVRNFPVQDVIDMGADYIIGVDVGAPLRARDEINSLFDVMDQVMSFRGDRSTAEQRKKCDILIVPDITGIDAASFKQVKDIIGRGEKAALEKLDELKSFSASLKNYTSASDKVSAPHPPPFFVVKQIRISGLKNVSRHLVLNKLLIKPGDRVTVGDIEEAVNRIYGTRFFERVNYRIYSHADGDILEILVIEKHPDVLKVGLHYDSDIRSSVLINVTLRNLWLKGSKMAMEGNLGENPVIHASYFYYTDWRPNVGLGLDVSYSDYTVSGYDFSDISINEIRLKNITSNLATQTILLSSLSVGVGIQFDRSSLFAETFVSLPDQLGTTLPVRVKYQEKFSLYNLFTYLRFDSYDRTVYPRSGLQAAISTEYIPDIEKSNRLFRFYLTEGNTDPLKIEEQVSYSSFWRFRFAFKPIFEISERFSMGMRFGIGLTSKVGIPLSYNFFLGGIVRETRSYIPFYGLPFLSTPTNNYILGGLRFQYQVLNRIYFLADGNIAKISSDLEKVFTLNNLIQGYGATIGIDSPVGPLEFSVINGNQLLNWISYINIGFRF